MVGPDERVAIVMGAAGKRGAGVAGARFCLGCATWGRSRGPLWRSHPMWVLPHRMIVGGARGPFRGCSLGGWRRVPPGVGFGVSAPVAAGRVVPFAGGSVSRFASFAQAWLVRTGGARSNAGPPVALASPSARGRPVVTNVPTAMLAGPGSRQPFRVALAGGAEEVLGAVEKFLETPVVEVVAALAWPGDGVQVEW